MNKMGKFSLCKCCWSGDFWLSGRRNSFWKNTLR